MNILSVTLKNNSFGIVIIEAYVRRYDYSPNNDADYLNTDYREAYDQLRHWTYITCLTHFLNATVEYSRETICFSEQSRQTNGQTQAHAKSQNET